MRSVPAVLLSLCFLLPLSCKRKTETSSHPPPATVHLVNPNPGKALVLPFEIVNNKCVVACAVNGKPARLIVDTACDYNCLFENAMQKFGAKALRASGSTFSASGRQTRRLCSPFKIEFPGGIAVENENSPVLPNYYVPEIDGILGNPVLQRLNAVIDYGRKTITINGRI